MKAGLMSGGRWLSVLPSLDDHQGLSGQPGLVQTGQGLAMGQSLQAGAVYGKDGIPTVDGTFHTGSTPGEYTMDLSRRDGKSPFKGRRHKLLRILINESSEQIHVFSVHVLYPALGGNREKIIIMIMPHHAGAFMLGLCVSVCVWVF